MLNGNNLIKWIKIPENREAFEKHVVPLVCEFNGQIVGGNWKIMYQPWAFDMALSMSEAGVADRMIDWEDHPEKPGELYPVYNWSRIAFVFGFYGKLLKTKWKGLLSKELREQLIAEHERIFKHYGTRPD